MTIMGSPDRFPTETRKISYATRLLRDGPLTWMRNKMQRYVDSGNPALLPFATIQDMFKALKEQYGDPHEVREAERKLQTIRQKGSIQNYNDRFTSYSALVEWGDEALSAAYYTGLAKEVQQAIAIRGDEFDEWTDLRSAATNISSQLYDIQRGQKSSAPLRKYNGGHGGDKMDLDATYRVKPGRKDTNCYQCGKKGHRKAECTESSYHLNQLDRVAEINALEEMELQGEPLSDPELDQNNFTRMQTSERFDNKSSRKGVAWAPLESRILDKKDLIPMIGDDMGVALLADETRTEKWKEVRRYLNGPMMFENRVLSIDVIHGTVKALQRKADITITMLVVPHHEPVITTLALQNKIPGFPRGIDKIKFETKMDGITSVYECRVQNDMIHPIMVLGDGYIYERLFESDGIFRKVSMKGYLGSPIVVGPITTQTREVVAQFNHFNEMHGPTITTAEDIMLFDKALREGKDLTKTAFFTDLDRQQRHIYRQGNYGDLGEPWNVAGIVLNIKKEKLLHEARGLATFAIDTCQEPTEGLLEVSTAVNLKVFNRPSIGPTNSSRDTPSMQLDDELEAEHIGVTPISPACSQEIDSWDESSGGDEGFQL